MRGRYGISLSRCACGRLIRSRCSHCALCLVKMLDEPTTPRTPAPKHQPSSYYVQHDPIASRFRWAQAVAR